jgi:hypothetical protein
MLCVSARIHWVVQHIKQHPFLFHAGSDYTTLSAFFFFTLVTCGKAASFDVQRTDVCALRKKFFAYHLPGTVFSQISDDS